MTREFDLPEEGSFVMRIWSPDATGPIVARVVGDRLEDITSIRIPTMQALLEADDPADLAFTAPGVAVMDLGDLARNAVERPDPARPVPLAPCDIQAIKACGVTFAASMLERVIEEKAMGDPSRADDMRRQCTAVIGDSLQDIRPGSDAAMQLKETLIELGVWSQYLEVGIGPDAEVFTKAQPMSAVGTGAAVGLHPVSTWNNPEPEIVLAVDSRGRIKGATLGNDVNLRDVEGRSALLLGKAKDNNAACAIGPALRLFDTGFGLDDIRRMDIDLTVTGPEGFTLNGHSSMAEISRDPEDLVAQVRGPHHQYPDGVFLFLGTLFAPTEDRDIPGKGFTHKLGDVVRIHTALLGSLQNTVRLSTEAPEWTFGTAALMRNLAQRNLL
ncbi:fumarylacetoacetate hydrolase [Rhodophyticola sp. CCM32]|uniref:fumarylacetoacetate hydrolase family protein n=1 Tax=Rhodophyticola sp. CCM32 TaxID=2916397 RepID=UPI00107F754E|nr:fumarylacetoacetate hydrolase family protein [Rhodophyticola sp. CCM32]QBY00068.1 fumarylacetoacetate hydrolase [Rhodophyticola sp. CCM32]